MQAKISIETTADWDFVRAKGLNVVADATIFPTADVFLRGTGGRAEPQEQKQPRAICQAISSNIGSLSTLFVPIILE